MSSINTNIAAYYAQNNLRSASAAAQSSISRLSSGNAIVSASDDVSGLAIGTILRTNVSTLKTASSNASQGISLLQVADGALSSLGDILQRQKALATQANSGTLSDTERGYLNQEFQSLTSEYNQIVGDTNFNGVNLLNGAIAASSTSIATEIPTGTSKFTTVATSASAAPSTAVITGGASGLTVTTVGTSTAGLNALQGSLAGVQVSAVYSNGTTLSSLNVVINGVTFRSSFNAFNSNATSTVALTQVLSAADTTAGKTATVLQLTTANQGNATASQVGSSAAALAVQSELAKVSIYQDRGLENTAATDPSAITTAKFSGTVLQGISGNDFVLRSADFDSTTGKAPSLTNFQITSNTATNATFSVKVNGVTYSSANTPGNSGGIDLSAHTDITLDDLDGTSGSGTGVLRLTSADDSNSFIDIDLGTNTPGAITLGSQADATGLAAALNGGFGSGSSGGLQFQVGNASTDAISISLGDISTSSVYKDNNGASANLDISTQTGAAAASGVLDNAIGTVTSARSSVGALQERFNYATATLGTSIQNLDAARSAFLDTDVSAESTKFATEQVLQQAAISVLAQANQIPQNLLKLIG